MKNIFKKSNIPFMKELLHNGQVRDNWNLARIMQDQNGLQHQLPAEIALFSRGASQGDTWSMCEAARLYFNHCGDLFLPQALSLWKKAVLQNDNGAIYDVNNMPIVDRVLSYQSYDNNEYTAIEMKCALLTECYLTKLGLCPWENANAEERIKRCENLTYMVCQILKIPQIKVEFTPNLTFNGMIVDGLAHWDYRISIRAELLNDYERLIEVLFHELGHQVVFEITRNNENSNMLKQIYIITDERIASWHNQAMGYEVPTTEEDPDTLSYGVYTMWATFFLNP